MLYWEDFEVGSERNFGSHVVTEQEVLAFGREFDPQPFHIDAAAAAASPFAGLVASGWQTGGWCMRMLVDNLLNDSTSMGSPGLESLRWKHPVRPGDRLRVRGTVLARRASRSRPEMGLVKSEFAVYNQNDTCVMTMLTTIMFGRRPDSCRTQVET